MKSTILKKTTLLLGVFILFAQLSEAKNNFSNKQFVFDDKPKANSYQPVLLASTSEVLPEFSSKATYNVLDKFTPEQLNRIIGVWPESKEEAKSKVQATAKVEKVEILAPVAGQYSPEQFVEILGLQF